MNSATDFFKELINSIIPFSESEFNDLLSVFEEKTFNKGDLLISIGSQSDNIYLIYNGIVREYTLINNEEHTLWISSQGECVLDPIGWSTGSLSQINAEAIISTQVFIANKTDFTKLLLSSPKFSIVMNVMYQKSIEDFHNYMKLLKIYPAQKREQTLFNTKPHLFRSEVKVKHLASLLNIHPNTLSRIHNNKASTGKSSRRLNSDNL